MKKYILLIAIIAIGIALSVWAAKHAKKVSYAKTISNKTGSPYTAYMKMGTDYLKAWSTALLLSPQPTYFTYNGSGYDISTGTVIGASGD